ncbi:MAG: hypothetical protein H5U10_14345 [Desulfacinum sp.]|nr:hypothetical protein [Desulfacinum sp.]
MAKAATNDEKNAKTLSGLPESAEPRRHYDIYAVLEAPQELYFGDEKEVNINIVEKVRVATAKGVVEKCYIAPSKRRGVERRCLLWSDAGGRLLMDKLQCGIPNTCCRDDCPVCAVFGGLIAGEKTFIGRLTHGGGVAVAPEIALEKQRAMHPALIAKEKDDPPMPYRKEYAQPGLLYPISNHLLSVTQMEFGAAAYAFLLSLHRLGAGNPKGLGFARAAWNGRSEPVEPLLVVDSYRVPLGERPLVSPSITDNQDAVHRFVRLAETYKKDSDEEAFQRRLGTEALEFLQSCAAEFEKRVLRTDS